MSVIDQDQIVLFTLTMPVEDPSAFALTKRKVLFDPVVLKGSDEALIVGRLGNLCERMLKPHAKDIEPHVSTLFGYDLDKAQVIYELRVVCEPADTAEDTLQRRNQFSQLLSDAVQSYLTSGQSILDRLTGTVLDVRLLAGDPVDNTNTTVFSRFEQVVISLRDDNAADHRQGSQRPEKRAYTGDGRELVIPRARDSFPGSEPTRVISRLGYFNKPDFTRKTVAFVSEVDDPAEVIGRTKKRRKKKETLALHLDKERQGLMDEVSRAGAQDVRATIQVNEYRSGGKDYVDFYTLVAFEIISSLEES